MKGVKQKLAQILSANGMQTASKHLSIQSIHKLYACLSCEDVVWFNGQSTGLLLFQVQILHLSQFFFCFWTFGSMFFLRIFKFCHATMRQLKGTFETGTDF